MLGNPARIALAATIGTLALVTAGSGSADAGPAPADATHPAAAGAAHSNECTTITGWTEQTENFYFIGAANPFPIQKVGDSLVYHDEIFAADGTVIGSAVGYVEAVDITSQNHILTTYVESSQTPDGTYSATGVVDRTAMLTSTGLADLSAVGTGGAYAGEHGTLSWKLEQVPPANASVKVDLTLTLCR